MNPVNNFSDFIKMIQPERHGKTKMISQMMEYYMQYPNNISTVTCSLEPMKSIAGMATCQPAPCQKKETDMNSYAHASAATINVSDTAESDMRRYLRGRLSEVQSDKKSALKKQFGMTGDEAPKNFEELLARINDGKYVIDEKDAKRRDYNNGLSYVQWRDPSVKEDEAGYTAAKAELYKAAQKVEDIIRVSPPTDGLKALQDFEASAS